MSKKQKSDRSRKNEMEVSKGVLEITRSGVGYVVTNESDAGDIFVRPNDFNTALNGDTVRVKGTRVNLNNGKREGRVTEIISRKQGEFIGHIQVSSNFAFFI